MFIKENGKKNLSDIHPEKSRDQQIFYLPEEQSCMQKYHLWSTESSHLIQGGLVLSCIVFVSIPPTVLNQTLISRDKLLVASLYVKPPKQAEVGGFESEKETNFSVDSTAKTNFQIKNNRKSQETGAQKDKAASFKVYSYPWIVHRYTSFGERLWFPVIRGSIFLFENPLDSHSTIVFVRPSSILEVLCIGWNIKKFCDRSLPKSFRPIKKLESSIWSFSI